MVWWFNEGYVSINFGKIEGGRLTIGYVSRILKDMKMKSYRWAEGSEC